MDHLNSTTVAGKSKTLLLVRHAKSSWEMGVASDFERTLNDRGKKDAPEMAQRIHNRLNNIDAFVSSPATRAKKTAEAFAEAYNQHPSGIHLIPDLYHANTPHFFKVINTLKDEWNTVAIFSHNPGITELVNMLIPEVKMANMPTCAVFAVKIAAESWKDFVSADKELLFFDFPKSTD
jgi:phosphohistidine phosphatase